MNSWADDSNPVRVVPRLDFQRYSGLWYEIARYPNRFQNRCVAGTTATYTPQPNGEIRVINACRTAGGKLITAKGTAKLADSKGPNSKLKVTFFWPFYGDYWVIGLDADYRWAIVGHPDRKYLWILSRTPKLDEATYRDILDRIRAQGYDVSRLIITRQDGT
jgi:apolipoprotein D and lipocalin family protein